MLVDERVDAIQKYIAAYNAFDVDGMLNLLARNVRFENWSGNQLTAEASGIDEFRQLAYEAKTMFSARKQRITSLQQDASSIMVNIAYSGQLAVDISDGPRSGTVLDLTGESDLLSRTASSRRSPTEAEVG